MDPAASASPTPTVPSPTGLRARILSLFRSHWPALVVTLGFLVLLSAVVREVKAAEGGRFVYTIDDSYFHLAVAKNLLRHGLWGISELDGFSSGTSSLLWPFLITLTFALFGIHEYFPLVLNILAAIGLLFYAGWILRRATGSAVWSLLVLAAVLIFTPILAVASTGMEHCLQALLALIFVDLASRMLTDDAQRVTSKFAPLWLCAVAMLSVMTRYEGLFLVAPVGLLLLCRRRWGLAVALGVLAAAPVVAFGWYALSKGWYFLPNSLMLKGNTKLVLTAAGLLQYFGKWYDAMSAERHVFILMLASVAALLGSLRGHRTLWNYPSLFLSITLLTMLQHLQFAGLGWFYRYEAYLVALSLVGIGMAVGSLWAEPGDRQWRFPRSLPYYAALLLAGLLVGIPLGARGLVSIRHVVTASYNIYEQQYQMGRFVRRFYNGKGVAVNDVGAVSFFGDVRILDVVGLSDINVLRARRAGNMNALTLQRLSRERGVEMAIVYDSWMGIYGGIPAGWVRVGRWTIPHNTIVGSETISFYAPGPEFVSTLVRHLQEYDVALPSDIDQDGLYRGGESFQVSGTYAPEEDGGNVCYWTAESAQFSFCPAKDVPLGAADTKLWLNVLPASAGQEIEVYFNDEQVADQVFSEENPPPGWSVIEARVKWREGLNTLRVVGRGKSVTPPDDGRALLFKILDPRKMMDPTGKIVPQRSISLRAR